MAKINQDGSFDERVKGGKYKNAKKTRFFVATESLLEKNAVF